MAIRLEACGKHFADGTRALLPLDLEIAAGERVVLLGPSGCGKTTTLRLIAGLERPDPGGRVLFGEEEVTHQPIERRRVGMVFQSYALFPNLDVAGNVAYGLKVQGVAKVERRRRMEEMLSLVHLERYAGRRVDQLSGGQRQRVALARALAVRPRVLLLDEPLTALDAKLREALRLEIDGLLRGLGVTTVYVTHDQAEAMALGDRIVIMNEGRVEQVGPPREIYLSPANGFVAGFVGTMNSLSAVVADGALRFGAMRLPLPDGRWPDGRWPDGCGEEGARVRVLFRPESARVGACGQEGLPGRVEATYFHGDHLRLVVRMAALETVIVPVDNGADYRAGQDIGLILDPGRFHVLPFEARDPDPLTSPSTDRPKPC